MRLLFSFLRSITLTILAVASPAVLVHAQTNANCTQHSDEPYDTGVGTISGTLGYETSTPLSCTEYIIPQGTKFIAIKAIQSRSGTESARLTLKAYVNENLLWDALDNTPIGGTPPPGFATADSAECIQQSPCNSRWRYLQVSTYTASHPAALVVEYAVEGEELTGNNLTLDAIVWYRPAFALSRTPWEFIPRDARDSASECSNPTNDVHCYPRFGAQIYSDDSGDYGFIKNKIRFRLKNITSLRGTSVNQGDSTELDYAIEASRQSPDLFGSVSQTATEASVQTSQPTDSAAIVITSRDFGGTARLEAELDFPEDPDFGPPLVAEVTEYGSGDPYDQRLPAHASNLPFDTNNNGIADIWEEQHLGSGGRFANITEDEEPGYDPDSPKGDGLSVHDEYRGLHNIKRDGLIASVRHLRFDPNNVQDVFYIDRDNAFVGSVGVILVNQKKSSAPQTIHKYWEVNRDQGQIEKGKRQSASRLAKNSNTGGENVGTFAILLTPDIPPADQAVDKNTKVLGWAQTEKMDGKAILIDRQAIISLSPSRQIDPDTFIAKVVAHEFGHKLSLEHPVRPNCCFYQPAITSTSQLSNLTMGEFALLNQPSNTIYVRLRSYIDPIDGNKEYSDERLQILSNGPVLPLKKEKLVSFPDGTHVYRVTLNRRINSTFNAPNGTFATWSEVLEIQQKLMDWTAVRILRQPADWKFAEGPRNPKRSNIEQLKAKE